MSESETASLLDDPRAHIGAAPIGDPPAGEDLRNDPAFEALDTEFRKMETGGPGAVDWKVVNEQSLDLLANRSKDLALASRLAYGLYRTEGYKGLAVGISILNGMVSEHWEGLFPPPKRERGRAGNFDWLAEKLASSVEAEPPADGNGTFALVAYDVLIELDDALSEKLGKFPATLGPLVRALRPYANDARAVLESGAASPEIPDEAAVSQADTPAQDDASQADAPPAQPTPSPELDAGEETAATPAAGEEPPPAPPVPAAVAPAVADISTDEGIDKSLQSLFNAASKVGIAVRQQAPSDPRAYLCARFAVWGQIVTAPPDSAGKTALPPPQKAKLAEIESLQSAGNSQGTILTAESVFVSSPFWLDAQYILVQAMRASGGSYDAARAAVVGQLAAFLARLPSLTGLTFSDGTPFAASETLNWINNEVRGSGDGNADAGTSALDTVKAEAEKLGRSGKILDGLKLMTEHAESCFGERARFVARLEIGEYCLRFDVLQPLFPLLNGLRRNAEHRGLDQWEPGLAVALASLCWRGITHKGASRFYDERESHEQKARIMATLAELDIVTAARLGSEQAS